MTAGTAMSDAPVHPATGLSQARHGLHSDSSSIGISAKDHAASTDTTNLATAESLTNDVQRSPSLELSSGSGSRLSTHTAPTGSLSDKVKVSNSDSPDESLTPRAAAGSPVSANWTPSTPSPAPTSGQTSRGRDHSNDMQGEPGCTLMRLSRPYSPAPSHTFLVIKLLGTVCTVKQLI